MSDDIKARLWEAVIRWPIAVDRIEALEAENARLREVIVTRWGGFRPRGWSAEDHLEHPCVNTSSEFDKDLATAAAEITRAALAQDKGQET